MQDIGCAQCLCHRRAAGPGEIDIEHRDIRRLPRHQIKRCGLGGGRPDDGAAECPQRVGQRRCDERRVVKHQHPLARERDLQWGRKAARSRGSLQTPKRLVGVECARDGDHHAVATGIEQAGEGRQDRGPGGDRLRLARAIVRRIDECGNLDCARRGNRAEAMPAE